MSELAIPNTQVFSMMKESSNDLKTKSWIEVDM